LYKWGTRSGGIRVGERMIIGGSRGNEGGGPLEELARRYSMWRRLRVSLEKRGKSPKWMSAQVQGGHGEIGSAEVD